MTVGALDGVGGLGPKRRARLIEQFGGLSGLREASREELMGVSWLPAEVSAAVFERLHTPLARSGPPSERRTVDTATERSDTAATAAAATAAADTAAADTAAADTAAADTGGTEVDR
jgi:excinuclease ABC subunit C